MTPTHFEVGVFAHPLFGSRLVKVYGLVMSKGKQKTMAGILREAIEKSGESDYAIAKASGVPQSTVTRFHNGQRDELGLINAGKLAEFLGYSLVKDKK